MPGLIHIVLQKAFPDAPSGFVDEWIAEANGLQGRVPGLVEIKAGRCLPQSQEKAQGFDCLLVTRFNSWEEYQVYAKHDLHQHIVSFGKGKWDNDKKIVYDLEV